MPGDIPTKVGHGLAKVLRLKLPEKPQPDAVTRGESTFSVGTFDTYSYVEPEPTAAEWFAEITPSWKEIGLYFYRLFPFLSWITRYNTTWLIGDLVAGITVGAVVVPQGMAYAQLAQLPVEYGLYSSFMGVLIYWFFATSKDITIGVRTTTFLIAVTNSVSLLLSCLLWSETSLRKPQRLFLMSSRTLLHLA